jgi:preprotein translocase subunit SecE
LQVRVLSPLPRLTAITATTEVTELQEQSEQTVIGRIRTYLAESWTELRKVAWPTRQTVINLTLIVVAVSIAVGAYIAVLDLGFTGLLDQVL